MRSVSRRGFLVLGGTGATGAVLAACGSAAEPREEGRDPDLLGAAYTAETALGATYGAAAEGSSGAEATEIDRYRAASDTRAEELSSLAADAGAEPADGESGGSDVAAAIAAADGAVGAYREASGLLSSTELRTTATADLAEVAAELAGLRLIVGDDPVPTAFVTGGAERPLQSTVGETTSSTTSTTSTTDQGE